MKIVAVEKEGYPPTTDIFIVEEELKDEYPKIPDQWKHILSVGYCDFIEGWDEIFVQRKGKIIRELI